MRMTPFSPSLFPRLLLILSSGGQSVTGIGLAVIELSSMDGSSAMDLVRRR